MYPEAHIVNITTVTDAAVVGYTPVVRGRVLAIKYIKDDFAVGVDFNIRTENTDQALWVQENQDDSATKCPRQPTHDSTGVASSYAAGAEPVEDYIHACGERVKITITNGGTAKDGQFIIIIG